MTVVPDMKYMLWDDIEREDRATAATPRTKGSGQNEEDRSGKHRTQ